MVGGTLRGRSRGPAPAPGRGSLARAPRDASSPQRARDEAAAQKAAQLFTAYLRACRDERFALSVAAARPFPDARRS